MASNIDTQMVDIEQRALSGVKVIYARQRPMVKFIIIIVALVAIALILWWIGRTVVGFMYTPVGLLLIAITVIALMTYLYLRSKGVGFKSWTGGGVEIMLVIMFLVVYVGLFGAITGVVLMLAPFIIFGAVAFIGYKWYRATENKYTAQGIIAMVIAFCVAVPIYQSVVVPYTLGTPVELTVDIMRDETGNWEAWVELHPFAITSTMTTQFNPFLISAVEFSNWMWTTADTTDKVYVDISIQVESDNTVIYYESGHTVYVGYNDMETIWGVVHIPAKYEQYVNVQIRMTAQVYDAGGILATASGVYQHN